MKNIQKIEISSKTIIFTVFFLLFLKLLWIIRDLLFSLFIAFIIMSAIKPIIKKLEEFKIPRFFSIFIIFLFSLFFIGYSFYWFIPSFMSEFIFFIKNFPQFLEKIIPNASYYINFSALSQYLPDFTNQFINLIKNIFSNATFIISTLFFSFYFSLEEEFIKKFLMVFFEEERAEKTALIFEKMEKRLQRWFWGELFLMMVVGVLTYIGLNLIGIKQALFLAIIAGLLEVIPNFGPILSAVPAVLIGLSQSYFLGLTTIALYFVVQQLENNLIVPLIMKKAVGLNPIIVLIALIIGGRIGGILGIVLAIPFTICVETLILEIIKPKTNDSVNLR